MSRGEGASERSEFAIYFEMRIKPDFDTKFEIHNYGPRHILIGKWWQNAKLGKAGNALEMPRSKNDQVRPRSLSRHVDEVRSVLDIDS